MYVHHTSRLWPEVWPQNKCRSLWPIFHDPVILPCIFDYSIYEHHYKVLWISMTWRWPKNKCRSLWPIFPGPLILRYILKTIWFMNIIASYLEDYLMENCCTSNNESVWIKDWPYRIYVGQWPVFHGPLILPFIIVIDFYTLRNGAGRGYSCPCGHLL